MSPDKQTPILIPHDLSSALKASTVSVPVTCNFKNDKTNKSNFDSNMVLSRLSLERNALLIQQPQVIPITPTIVDNNSQQENQRFLVSSSKSVHPIVNSSTVANNIGNLPTSASISGNTTEASIFNTSCNLITTVHNNSKMSGTPKYVFLQQNNNGQYTTIENPITSNNNSKKNVRNIVLVAAEPIEINSSNSGGKIRSNTVNGDNDEELRPLAWLNDSNLIKDIVTTSSATGSKGSTISTHRNVGSNICIVNANSAHEITEELNQDIGGEENIANSIIDGSDDNEILDTHVSTLSLTDFQQQFIASNKHLENISAISSYQSPSSYANIPTSKTNSPRTNVLRDQQKLSYSNTTCGATTTVHVGPSGTTTVVEYKSNANFTPSRRHFGSNSVSTNTMNNTTTITSTNSSNRSKNNSSSITSAALSNPSTPCIVTAATANYNSISGRNCAVNTIYQVNQKESDINGANCTNSNNFVTTTHHPHKKYLREKMNSLENGESNANIISPSAISVVSSPASSTNSLSSSSTSSSTAAVNGGSSPILKSFYAMSSNAGNNSLSTVVHYLNSPPTSSNIHAANSSTTAPTSFRHYNIVGQQNNASSNFEMTSPDPPDTAKDFYNTSAPQPSNPIRSPISYSSFEKESLKEFEISSISGARLNTSTPQHQNSSQQQQQSSLKSPSSVHSNTPQKQKHPNNVPYDPLIHTHNKPPYSFSSLIFMAIEGSTEKALPVKEIYAWIVQHFPYFKTAPTGWKNSVRHNLSLNKSFVKVEKAPNMGKGSLWRVEQQQRQNLIQALTRSPFFSNSAVDKGTIMNFSEGSTFNLSGYDYTDGNHNERDSSHLHHRFDPPLFPKLAKAFKNMSEQSVLSDIVSDVLHDEISSTYGGSNQCNKNWSYLLTPQSNKNGASIIGAFSSYESIEHLARDCGADSIEDVNAATAMLALKHGPNLFSERFQNGSAPVITSSPSEDHTYSAGGGSTADSGASTPITNGSIISLAIQGSNNMGHTQQNISGNQSNCASSSDAAYESSEENHNNITTEELEDRQRHRDGVDALLSLSVSSVLENSESSAFSTQKGPTSVYIEDESLLDRSERSRSPSSHHANESCSKRAILANAATNAAYETQQLHCKSMDEGYNTQSYFGYQNLHQVGLPSPPKKVKPLRGLRTKLKRKAPWMR